jgi:hypothetical protein
MPINASVIWYSVVPHPAIGRGTHSLGLVRRNNVELRYCAVARRRHRSNRRNGRGRDEDFPSPAARIPACAANAPGSSFGSGSAVSLG